MKNSNTPKCSIENCDNKIVARGWCNKHYTRWLRHGDPLLTYKFSDPKEAFSAKTVWQGSCLIWTGPKNSEGYGTIADGGKRVYVHRYAWEKANGEIPDGMMVDHRFHCLTTCCNVKHLRLATIAQNNYNRSGASKSNKTSGVRNVFWEKQAQKWQVAVKLQGKRHYFGRYSSLKEAALVAEHARQELFGEFAGRG